jgi:hypothetical protein
MSKHTKQGRPEQIPWVQIWLGGLVPRVAVVTLKGNDTNIAHCAQLALNRKSFRQKNWKYYYLETHWSTKVKVQKNREKKKTWFLGGKSNSAGNRVYYLHYP